MKEHKNIAVLMTCHNRKEKTISCLDSIFANQLLTNYELEIYLVDDGSTDGTADVVRERYPSVNIIQGSGSLYWSGGMRIAFSEAMEKDYDYYLWLNDDSNINLNSLTELINFSNEQAINNQSLVIGSMCDPLTGELTYGGIKRKNKLFNQISMERILLPHGEATKADTMNGNCVLVPRYVAQQVGNIDEAFSHSLGDYDYGLRATKLDIDIWVLPTFLGTCTYDHIIAGSYEDKSLTLSVRFKKVTSVKGLPPYAWFVYCRRHAGFMWPFIWCNRYVRVILSSVFY